MDFTEKHFFIHATPPVVVVVLPLLPLLHVLQFKRIGLRSDLLLWPGESPGSAYVCVEAVHQKVISATNEPNIHSHTNIRDAVAFLFTFFCSVVQL